MNDIHKRHAATIETEHKQIPRLLQPGMPPEIDRSNECYFLLAQSPFHRLPPANVQIGKRIVLANLHPLLACLVANRPEIAEVHVDSVLRNPSRTQIVHVVRNENIVHILELYLPRTAKTQQRTQPAHISICCSQLPFLSQRVYILQNELFHILVVPFLVMSLHQTLQTKPRLRPLQKKKRLHNPLLLLHNKTIDAAGISTLQNPLRRIHHPFPIHPIVGPMNLPAQRIFLLLATIQHTNRKRVNFITTCLTRI